MTGLVSSGGSEMNESFGNLKDILSIPYDYSGYDLVFEEETTDPGVYAEINALVTNGGLDISEVEGYEDLSNDSSEDEFWDFYDNWVEALEENGFVTELTMADDIGAFAEEINRILGNVWAPEKLDAEAAVSAFRAEVVKYSFQGKPSMKTSNTIFWKRISSVPGFGRSGMN